MCVCECVDEIHLKWPPAAAWVWGHFWNPLQCSQSVSRPSSSGSYTKLWRSEREKIERVALSTIWLCDEYIHRHWQLATQLYLHTHTYIHTQLDVSLLRAGSKLLSKAWTVLFNLWPCYGCGCWRGGSAHTHRLRHLCQFDCWLNSPEQDVTDFWFMLLFSLFVCFGKSSCGNHWRNTKIL